MGFFFGLASAFCFASASIFFKIGQRSRPDDDGHLIGNAFNVAVFVVFAFFIDWPAWTSDGFLALAVAGIMGTVVGRWGLLRAVRLIGPARTNTFHTATPIPAAIFGWILLGEGVEPLEAVGGALTIFGLVRIVQSRSKESSGQPVALSSYLIAALAPASFGVAFVLRKWGVERMPGAVSGALIGSATGLVVVAIWDLARGRLGTLLRGAVTNPPVHYFAAGVASGLALLSQFRSLALIDAWIVGILGGTAAIFTPFLSAAFLKNEDSINARLLANISLVFSGVVIIALV